MDSKIAPRILELLAAHPMGVSSQAAQQMLNASQNGVCRAAKGLAEAGRIVIMKRSSIIVMCLPEQADAVRRHMRAEADKRADREKVRKAEWRRKRIAAQKQWYGSEVETDIETPVHRRVPASSMQPLAKLGPASIWELAKC